MKFLQQKIEGLFVLEPNIFRDERGIFRRHFCQKELQASGVEFNVAQGNISENFAKHTLRGFHYSKLPSQESKILSCVSGAFWNVVIDVRPTSPSFMNKFCFEISADNRISLLVPAGCANGFLTLKDNSIAHYYMNDFYGAASDSGFRFDDPQFDVAWPFLPQVMSEKDLQLPNFSPYQL
ncbi:MAG: dTDP-4-dehydrorhamnose 3,5-epimerase [Sulfitobacter sp.]|nr:MAG: dTDP-4-dehydrorhamnose 3,5-epimerase [Sulfitobacter sp.]